MVGEAGMHPFSFRQEPLGEAASGKEPSGKAM